MSHLKGSGPADPCGAAQQRTAGTPLLAEGMLPSALCQSKLACSAVLQPGSCPPVPSCPSALLPQAQTLPSSSSARLAAMQATVRQRLPTEVQRQDTREWLFKDGNIWCGSSCGDCVNTIAAF